MPYPITTQFYRPHRLQDGDDWQLQVLWNGCVVLVVCLAAQEALPLNRTRADIHKPHRTSDVVRWEYVVEGDEHVAVLVMGADGQRAGLDADRCEIVVAVILVGGEGRCAASQLHRGAGVALVVDIHTVGGAEPRDKRYLPSNLFAHIISLWYSSHGNRLRLGWCCWRKAGCPYR